MQEKFTPDEEIEDLVVHNKFMNDNFEYSSSCALNQDTEMNQSLRTGTNYSLEPFDCI